MLILNSSSTAKPLKLKILELGKELGVPLPSSVFVITTPVYTLLGSLDVLGFNCKGLTGAFLITVICFSSISTEPKPKLVNPEGSFISLVWLVKLRPGVPASHLAMFIFLGSFLLSVQNNIPSIIFIPVTMLLGSNFKTFLFESLKINLTLASPLL